MTDKHGNVIEDRIYTGADMNRKLVLERRDEVVAAKITEYLKATDRYAKTIVFCEDIDHAARMRQALSNANADICATQPKYVVQITGDNPEGKRELDNFIDPEKPYPVIATTSKLMSTGRGRANLQAHRAGPEHQVHDAVQADHWPRHPPARRPGQDLVHHPRLQARHRQLCRQGL
jgi:hypothetical protein